jgi:hypothetical protein
MPGMYRLSILYLFALLISSCNKKETPAVSEKFTINSILADGKQVNQKLMDVSNTPVIKIFFSAPVDKQSAISEIRLINNQSNIVAANFSFENKDSVVNLIPSNALDYFSPYIIQLNGNLLSANAFTISNPGFNTIITRLDSADKFPRIPDAQLLDSVQRRSFAYFWEFGHPVSGMARERNTSGDLVTSGGTGFGVMAMLSAINRGFISREEGRDRIQKITGFLLTKATRYHGAFAHWINGATGATIPFSTNDNGADLVETSYLIQGLLSARQYFDAADPAEISLRTDINSIWEAVEWDWFRKGNENALYWHWSADKGWVMNMKIQGWNECLITYILAASSPTHAVPIEVYENGFTRNGSMRNGIAYYGYTLPLGPSNGGPLFWAHYSFLGIDPNGLKDKWADYELQVKNHSLINHAYCKANPRKHYGYSDSCWGLTASDNSNGYSAHEPNNDPGVISPTAALSSMPFTPTESMKALHFFYYTLGDKTWKPYGFIDAFELGKPWFANSFLAIDQGPIMVMIENHRSGLLWNLMKTCPEVKTGMKKLGFTAPYL